MQAHGGGRLPLLHFDAWMEGREKALLADGGDEFLGGEGLAVVEWAGRIEEWLPEPAAGPLTRPRDGGIAHPDGADRGFGLRRTRFGPALGRLGPLGRGERANPVNHPGPEALNTPLKDSWDGESDPLAALREGRQAPFEEFVTAETHTFLGFFARLGATRSECEDLVQETFLKLFRTAAQTHPGTHYDAQGQFTAYAFRVARNVWIDRSRKRLSAPRVFSADAWSRDDAPADAFSEDRRRESAASGRPESSIEQAEESSKVERAVAELNEAHRLVFELGVVQELPYSDIARSLDIPVGTVKSRMFNAVRKVRDSLLEADRVRDAVHTRADGGPLPGPCKEEKAS